MSFKGGGRGRGPGRATAGGLLCLIVAAALGLVPAERSAVAGKLEELSHMLLEDESYKVRTQAAQLLGRLGDPAAVGPLGKALADSNKTVRWMAVQALAKLANPAAAPALKALLARETDGSVRAQAEKALSALGAGLGGGKRPGQIFLTFGSFSGGTRSADGSALEVLRQSLRRSLAKLPSVTFDGGDAKSFSNGGQLGFFIDGNVSRLDDAGAGAGGEINCDVKVMVARWPSKSIILWTNAGAAVTGGSRPQDIANARRDCLEASAGQLAEDLVKFFQSQGG
jgi:hypothetical protein